MLDTADWKFFTIEEIFEKIDSTKGTTTDILVNGNEVPYICASKINNGFDYMVARDGNEEFISKGNCVVLVQIGAGGAGYATYQDADFIGMSGKTVACYTKFLNKERGLFLSTVLSQERFRYCYGRSWTGSRLRNTKVRLPVTSNSEIDWEWIDSYMHSIDLSAPVSQNILKNGKIDTSKWEQFKVGEIFNIFNGKGITKEEIEENLGSLEAVQSGEKENGVIGFISESYCREKKYTYSLNPCLAVARTGSAGFVSFHPHGCVVGDSAKILQFRDGIKPIENYLYLQAILTACRFKYTYGRKVTTELYLDETISLPSTEQGEPDWQFMENYIKSLPYGDCI